MSLKDTSQGGYNLQNLINLISLSSLRLCEYVLENVLSISRLSLLNSFLWTLTTILVEAMNHLPRSIQWSLFQFQSFLHIYNYKIYRYYNIIYIYHYIDHLPCLVVMLSFVSLLTSRVMNNESICFTQCFYLPLCNVGYY